MTVVHLLRHGEVHNAGSVLYGRMPGFVLSELGHRMAQRATEALGDRDIVRIVSSPLERAQETAAPLADRLGLAIVDDPRVTEAASVFEGKPFAGGEGVLRQPLVWRHLWNPVRPSWGEPYKAVVQRMLAAVEDARRAADGHEAVVVSHQLPIWATRLRVEGRRLVHDPRRRQCSLCSVTSLTFEGDRVVSLAYSEPAADLLPVRRSTTRRDRLAQG